MAQKLILCSGEIGSDLTQDPSIAAAISAGYEITSVDGFSTQDNRNVLAVLLAEPVTESTDAAANDAAANEGTGTSEGTNAGTDNTDNDGVQDGDDYLG